MNSNVTVSDCRRAFGDLFTTSEFIPLMNQGLEMLLNSGRWKGSLVYVTFLSGSTGFITLPYEYSAIMGVSIGQWPVPVFSQFHPYIESGPGIVEDTELSAYYLNDLGDGYSTLIDIPDAGSNIQVTIGNIADNNKTIRFYGISNGLPIYDANGLGFDFTTAGLSTIGSVSVDAITGIEMPVNSDGSPEFIYPWFLYAIPPGGGLVQLGEYFPADIRPSYRRYQTGVTTQVVTCLCQKRFIPVYKETDWVFPGSVRAVKAAMQAVQAENANNYDSVVDNWAIAYDTLNKMVHNSRGSAKPELNYVLFGDGVPFPDLN